MVKISFRVQQLPYTQIPQHLRVFSPFPRLQYHDVLPAPVSVAVLLFMRDLILTSFTSDHNLLAVRNAMNLTANFYISKALNHNNGDKVTHKNSNIKILHHNIQHLESCIGSLQLVLDEIETDLLVLTEHKMNEFEIK